MEPDIFVLDEPSSNLDAYSIADFQELLKYLKAQGKSYHDIAEHRLYYLMIYADQDYLFKSMDEIQGD